MPSWTTAFAPATCANLGPGYDILGLALDAGGLGDTCEVRIVPGGAIRIAVEGDGGRLPLDPARNSASVAAQAVIDAAGVACGIEMRLHKGLPLGSGLGSSAASAASAALATNEALGRPLGWRELCDAGRAGEAVCAGVPHPDNVVPSLLGGLLLMVEERGLQVVRLPVPPTLRVAVVIPELEVRTSDARAVLPPSVPRADAVANMGHAALLVSALYEGDLARLGLAVHDRLHEPYRAPLVRGFVRVRDAALTAGAVAAGLSGSGPALFALAEGDAAAQACGEAMVAAFHAEGVGARFASGRIAAQSLRT